MKLLKVFISWSGEYSHAVALALRDWLPKTVQQVEPFLSSKDIKTGQAWMQQIGSQLNETDFGILCLTADNLETPWLLFEAGALAKRITEDERVRVVPFLLGLEGTDVEPPLGQFQGVEAGREGTWKLIRSVNELLEKKIPEDDLSDIFDTWWPRLETALEEAASSNVQPAAEEASHRTSQDLLEEILTLTRQNSRILAEESIARILGSRGH